MLYIRCQVGPTRQLTLPGQAGNSVGDVERKFMSVNSPPIVCTLSDAQKREREATLLARFKAGVIAAEELDDGYSFRIPGGKDWFALAVDLITAEHECCPFLTFQLTAESQMGALTIRITGPEGAKEFLKSVFVDQVPSAAEQ
jgi:hypothetical protein